MTESRHVTSSITMIVTMQNQTVQTRGNDLIDAPGTRVSRIRGEMTGIRREDALRRSLENACLIANVCEGFRGKDTTVLDVTQVSPLFDFFVITTGNSRRQLRSIAEASDDLLSSRNSDRLGREGNDAPWICHDYGDVVLHVFAPDARGLYDLENLWGDAVRVDWQAFLAEKAAAGAPPESRETASPGLADGASNAE